MVAMASSALSSIGQKLARWRAWVQAAFLLVWLDPLALRLHSVCGPVFHCHSCPLAAFACPIGVLANFSALHVVPLMALGTLLLAGGLVATMVCGWACPFGFLQDLAGRAPTPKVRLPAWAGYGRYAVLTLLVAAVPFAFGTAHPLFVCRVCPAGGLEAALPGAIRQAVVGGPVVWPNALKLAVVALVTVSTFFTWRPWCRALCPLGAIYGAFNRVSIVFLRFHPQLCDGCGACARGCRYGADPRKRASDPHCIRCLECARCDALTLSSAFARARAGGKTAAIREADGGRT
jgi:polyferredoxin